MSTILYKLFVNFYSLVRIPLESSLFLMVALESQHEPVAWSVLNLAG